MYIPAGTSALWRKVLFSSTMKTIQTLRIAACAFFVLASPAHALDPQAHGHGLGRLGRDRILGRVVRQAVQG